MPRPAPPPAPRYQAMGMGAVMTVFLGLAIGSLVALFFRGGLQRKGTSTSMSSLFFTSGESSGSYQRSQAQQFLRSMEDATSPTGLAGGLVPAAATGSGTASSSSEASLALASAGAVQPPPSAACDCEACASLLLALELQAPPHWGDVCECGTCTALVRLSLQALGIPSLEVDQGFLAGAFGDVRALLGRMQGLTISAAKAAAAPQLHCPACPACPACQAAEQGSAAGAEGCRPCPKAPKPLPCPMQPPCPAAPLCSSESQGGPELPPGGSSSSSSSSTGRASPASAAAAAATPSTSSSFTSPLQAQLSGTLAAPAWSAALSLRGVPAPPCSVAHAYGPLAPSQCSHTVIAVPTRCVVGRHEDHWQFFVNMVTRTRAPMALLRYVDGERMIMQGATVGTGTQAWGEDKWQWEGGESRMARDMAAGLKGHYGEPVFYAFASPRDDEHGLRYYLDNTEATCGQITYANLWINGFYARTKAMLLHTIATQNTRIVLVANHAGIGSYPPCTSKDPALALAGCVPVPDNAVHSWEAEASRAALVEPALALAASLPPGALFIVCAGPLSKPLIAALWAADRRHQYIDFGSAMDETLKKRITRPYMDPASPYAKGSDPQWACHRGEGGQSYNVSSPASADFSRPGAEGRCFTFSTPEGE